MQGAAILPEEDEEIACSEKRPGEIAAQETDEGPLHSDAGSRPGRTRYHDCQPQEGLPGCPARPGPAPDDVPEVRSEDHHSATREDAEERPVAQEIGRLERLPEEKDEENGRQEEKVQGEEDDRVDERGQDAREETRGHTPHRLAVR